MSQPKFTPGPWYTEEAWGKAKEDPGPPKFCFIEIRKVDEQHIPVASTNSTNTRDEQLANARLIAAAPEMYEALEEIYRIVGQIPGKGTTQAVEIRQLIGQILEKARGES